MISLADPPLAADIPDIKVTHGAHDSKWRIPARRENDTMRGAIILGREGRRVYQNPLGHTSMPSIRIISMSTGTRFICYV